MVATLITVGGQLVLGLDGVSLAADPELCDCECEALPTGPCCTDISVSVTTPSWYYELNDFTSYPAVQGSLRNGLVIVDTVLNGVAGAPEGNIAAHLYVVRCYPDEFGEDEYSLELIEAWVVEGNGEGNGVTDWGTNDVNVAGSICSPNGGPGSCCVEGDLTGSLLWDGETYTVCVECNK